MAGLSTSVRVISKMAVIALIAAFAAWLRVALVFAGSMDAATWPPTMGRMFLVALLGSFGIGFPIAATIFFLARRELARAPSSLVLIVILVGVMIALTSFILLDESAAIIFGVPSLFAASAYALLGWLWLLKPLREAAND